MKGPVLLLALFFAFGAFGQGTDCQHPFNLALDEVQRTYTISGTTGTALHCTNPVYSGSGYITVFSFTTDASGSCVLVDISTSGFQPAEVLLYDRCSGGGALQNMETASSVCFDDGTGLWAPSETNVIAANKTYYLRVWTKSPGTLTLSAKSYSPTNNTCIGATTISPTPLPDNNACNKPSAEVLPEQLCAFSLENTAFYKYIVDVDGVSVLNINNISCDNSAAGATAGFQIGFFTGSCGSLTPVNCYAATGGSISASTASLPSGTQVIVAIDGMSGSNCTYTISAFNAVILPAILKYFSSWKAPHSNILRWMTLGETYQTNFEIEKSADGYNFSSIGVRQGSNGSNISRDYTFEDPDILPLQYYRLKMTAASGHFIYSNVISIKRENINKGSVIYQNPVSDNLRIRIPYDKSENALIYIVDASGRRVFSQNVQLFKGETIFTADLKSLSRGIYYLVIPGMQPSTSYSFIKQ